MQIGTSSLCGKGMKRSNFGAQVKVTQGRR